MGWGPIPSPGDVVDAVKDTASSAAGTVRDTVSGAGNVLEGTYDVVTGDFSGAQDNFRDAVGDFSSAGRNAFDFATAPMRFVGERIQDTIEDFGGALSWLVDRANSWLSSLFNPLNWIFKAVTSIFGGIKDLVERIIEKAREIFRGINAPDTLAEAARAWSEGPATNLDGLSQNISAQSLIADDGWTSAAGRAYVVTIPKQVAAVDAAQQLSVNTSTALSDASKALKTLYADAGGLQGDLYCAIQGSPGSLFSLENLFPHLNGGLFNMIKQMVALKEFGDTMKEIQQTLADQATENSAFPGGAWPKAAMA